MEKVTIAIQNLKCGGCATTIKLNLEKIEGVSGIQVDPDNGTVTLSEWTEDSLDTIKSELRRLGYPLVDEDNPFFSKVKSYASCVVGRMSSTEE
ncbi:MAG: heavy-metal-associated domain-containing protein [Crocinitomicaceae bacterium]|nr:heavy-metal-associated domain-containing protein [Crocinitomicaceae bacterium]